ncbi:MAG: hypothetical protein QXK00_03265 [archaeon]
MQEYPEETITINKKGKKEVRSLIDYGEYVRYEYLDPITGEKTENKVKLVLKSKEGKIEEFFIIPTKTGKNLLLKTETKGKRKIWNKGEIIEFG